ncbi:unnamed protein product [Spirodela intermedia]|uniref:Uncharacterized protein n=1 Tax=Spirodela intermedia TaxID=51605 RepID=A0A7I8L1G8_SPIIN|nr:unnamed protein product [Spirodela intermedia]
MSRAPLMRTRSGPLRSPLVVHHHDNTAGGISVLKRAGCGGTLAPLMSLHLDRRERGGRSSVALRRVRSEGGLSGYDRRTGFLSRQSGVGLWPEDGGMAPPVDVDFSCGDDGVRGGGGGRRSISESGGGGQSEIGAYYREMLKADPGNPLLLRNYGIFLHEVEGDAVGAEDCYARAILGDPGDGELLSLYGNLIWEASGDEIRAERYLERAVEASPEDSHVLGAYAHFLWDAEDGEEEEAASFSALSSSSRLVEAG